MFQKLRHSAGFEVSSLGRNRLLLDVPRTISEAQMMQRNTEELTMSIDETDDVHNWISARYDTFRTVDEIVEEEEGHGAGDGSESNDV